MNTTGLALWDYRGGTTYDPVKDGARLNAQHLRVYAVMSSGVWRSLAEISAKTGDPEASVSARLRDFRKPRFGSYEVKRRRRVDAGTWEYRVDGGASAGVLVTIPAISH